MRRGRSPGVRHGQGSRNRPTLLQLRTHSQMTVASEPARHRHFCIQPSRVKTSSATPTAGEATKRKRERDGESQLVAQGSRRKLTRGLPNLHCVARGLCVGNGRTPRRRCLR
jgi:hypothetical protein